MTKDIEEQAIDIFGRDEWNKMIEKGGSILDYMITSNVSVRYTPSHCERCKKKFRFYRKSNTILVKKSRRLLEVCIDCIDEEDDLF